MKVNGPIDYFSLFIESDVFFMVSYGLTKVSEDMYSWNELYFFKKEHPTINMDIIKNAIIDDINNDTDGKILEGFSWNNILVYLSKENQFNFKAAYDLAVQTNGASLPVRFKLGQSEVHNENIGTEEEPIYAKRGGDAVYHTFETLEDITDFYTKAIAFINQTLNDGWVKKDSIDWSKYEELLKPSETSEE